MKMEQSVPKRRHIKFRRRGITQEIKYNTLYIISHCKLFHQTAVLFAAITKTCDLELKDLYKN
jgi:hypothetical protein